MIYIEYNDKGELVKAYGYGKARDYQGKNMEVLDIDEWLQRLE